MPRKANKLSSAEREAIDIVDNSTCYNQNDMYSCTRKLGHRGKHYAGGSDNEICASWDHDGSNLIEY